MRWLTTDYLWRAVAEAMDRSAACCACCGTRPDLDWALDQLVRRDLTPYSSVEQLAEEALEGFFPSCWHCGASFCADHEYQLVESICQGCLREIIRKESQNERTV